MIERRIAVASLCALLLVSGCYRGPSTENPENTRGGPFVPWGVVDPGPGKNRSNLAGLYPSMTRYGCCGLGKEANLQILSPRRPAHLYLKFFTPDFSDITHQSPLDQSIEVAFSPKHHPVFRHFLPNKFSSLVVPVPVDAHIERNVLFLKLKMGFANAPGQYRPGADPRAYSIILLAAEAGN